MPLRAGLAASRPRTTSPDGSRKDTGVRATDTIVAAARKVLRFHFKHLLKHEAGTREGSDIEPLHQMRVATRRLRAALRVLGPYLPPKKVRRLARDLRGLTRALGPVRDLDVHIERAQNWGRDLWPDEQKTLEPLLEHLRGKRDAARTEMISYLNSGRCKTLKADFKNLSRADPGEEDADSQTDGAGGKPIPSLIGHIAPAMIWQSYQNVRTYETAIDGASVETLHALRIDCKRLRYSLEVFHEVLGEAGQAAIASVKKAQEHLGKMHDAYVAIHLVREFQEDWKRRVEDNGDSDAAVESVIGYLDACKVELRETVASFSTVWAELSSPHFRQLLGEATAIP